MTTIAAISLAAPAMLAGIAAVALPIAAHLMSRRTRQRLVFPTIRLLAESKATQSSLYRIRRWVLLILRCLAVIMVALAFAMPSCTPKAQIDTGSDEGKGAAVVVVLDISASLGREVGGVSLASTMKAVADRTLASLEPGADRVNVIYAAARPRSAFPFQKGQTALTANIAAAREDLKTLVPTQERADLPAAIAMAGDMLRGAGGGQKRLVIISDMQQANWRDVALAGDSSGLLPGGTTVTILPLDTGKPANLGLSEVRSEPIKPLLNQLASLIVKATNHSTAAVEANVAASLDGQPIGTQAIALNPGESRDVAFETVIATPGHHRAEFTLPDDALAADNRAYLSVAAVQRIPIVIVGDDNPGELGSASYFISRALAPRGDAGDLIEARHMTSADLAAADVSPAEAVFVSQINTLSAEAAGVLTEYLRRGGGVIFFSGNGSVPANMLALQAAFDRSAEKDRTQKERVTAWTPTVQRDLSGGDAAGGLRITDGEWGSDLLSEFDEQNRGALNRIRFTRVWSIADPNPAAKTLLKFSDQSPALSVLAVGEGRLVTANFTPALTGSDFGKYGSFVALTHSLARYVRPKRDWRSHATAGEPVVASAALPVGEAPGRFIVEAPAGKVLTPELSRAGSRMTVAIDRAAATGFYRVLRNDQPVADVAVNLDARESDLRPLDAAAIAEQLKTPNVIVEVKGQTTTGDLLDLRGAPLWHWFVLAAMLMIGLELALLAVWNR